MKSLSKEQVIRIHSMLINQTGGINGIEIECTDEELIILGLGLAEGSINDIELLNWIINHS